MSEFRQNTRIVDQDTKRDQRKSISAYKIEDDDILILSGPYAGFWVKAMWCQGADERDYIFRHIYKRGDPEAIRIVNSLFCN